MANNHLELAPEALVEEREDDERGPDALLLGQQVQQHLQVRRVVVGTNQAAVLSALKVKSHEQEQIGQGGSLRIDIGFEKFELR